jgi:hypothetical protein
MAFWMAVEQSVSCDGVGKCWQVGVGRLALAGWRWLVGVGWSHVTPSSI